MTSVNDLPEPETVRSVTKRVAAVTKPLMRIKRIMTMKRYLMAVIVLWTSSYINAGTASVQAPIDREVIARIRDEGLNRSKALETFTHFNAVLGPRLTATPAYKSAAEWARDKLKEWGLENPRLEAWEFGRGWTLEKFTVEMVEPRYMPLIGYPEAWSPSTAGELVASPIFLGDKTLDAIEQLRGKIKGAIVLSQPIQTVFEREDRPQPTLSDKPVAIGQPRPAGGTPPPANARDVARIIREAGAGVAL